jgi:TPR repeat protein
MRIATTGASALAILFCVHPAQAFDCLARATEHIENKDQKAATGAVKRGAREGDARCKFILGMWLLSGTESLEDPETGLRWLKSAAKDGLPAAQSVLGLLYASGVGVKRDDEVAVRWYRAAAEYGDPLGQFALGLSTFLGVGVEGDRINAYLWTSLAAAQGNENALAYLPTIESTLTSGELQQAKEDVAQFRPKVRKGQRRPSTKQLLRVVGLNRTPGEIERFFGFGGADR